jgi:outer membrane protein OmpA-like peptidoglycan-associated protein
MPKRSLQISRVVGVAGLLLALGAPGCATTTTTNGSGKIRVVGERINFYDKVRFESKLAVIKPESHRLLDSIAAVIKERPNLRRIRICGHTDNLGHRADNLRLSQARAEAVRQYLIGAGVAPGRLVAIGYGDHRPITSNRTQAGREKNRRVEFIILRTE